MTFKVGEEVIIKKRGENEGRIMKVKEKIKIATKLTMDMKPVCYYHLWDLAGFDIVIHQDDLEKFIPPIPNDEKTKCDCGGEYLAIPHHYEWCAKRNKNGKKHKDK